MSYRIAQSEEYRGSEYWNWSAWIEATPNDLDQLESVVWILHPTFSPSRVESRSRDTKFRLDTSGWGTFRLRAELHRPGKVLLLLSRTLRLTVPDDQEAISFTAPSFSSVPRKGSSENNPTIFLSYSSEDESQAQDIRQTMERLGTRVLDARSVSAGFPVNAAIQKMIRESDGIISLIGSDYASPNVMCEMQIAAAQEKPAITILPESIESPKGLSFNNQTLRFGKDLIAVESQLEGFVGKLRAQNQDLTNQIVDYDDSQPGTALL